MKTFKNILLVLSTGYIFVYFSEHLFWARVRPEDTLGEWMGAWIAYSLMAFVFLHLVMHFKVANLWALFLAGAAFGWMAEGMVVQTTYEMLPLSISFTGLAWHALITVWIGWYAIRQRLSTPASLRTLKLATAIGAGYGLWAITWWLEPDGGKSTLGEFSTFVLTTSVLVIIAYWLANWSASELFTPNRWVTGIIYSLFILYFVFIAVPATPAAIIILPVLLGLVYLGLRKNKQVEQGDSLLVTLTSRAHPLSYLSMLAMPVTAILVYTLALTLNLQWHTNWILYLITTPLGFILFGMSLFKVWRTP
ncbi:MAG: hypothetical protein HZB50_12845 [Chloroflexi bacterium]|nr:hypothetical protein [Chloroflexota bacterium]